MSQKNSSLNTAAVVIPPIQDFYFTYHRFSALGAKIVYKIVQNHFATSHFFNFPLLRKKPFSINLPDELSYLKSSIIENESGKVSFFSKYKHFGPTTAECAQTIIAANVDVCLISCFAFCYAQTAVELANELKKNNSRMIIIIGGAAVSASATYFLQSESIDYTVCGEAEISLPLLLDNLKTNSPPLHAIPNIGWNEDGNQTFSDIGFAINLFRNPFEETLRPGAQGERISEKIYDSYYTKVFTRSDEIIPVISRTHEVKECVYLSTTLSRGCTFECQFCSNRISQGSSFRTVDPEKFELELNACSESIGANEKEIRLNFEDDNILLDYAYLKKIILRCKSVFKNISFSFENGIDYRLLSLEQCRELIDLGVRQFNFSIGTADMAVSDLEGRTYDFSHLDKLYQLLSSNKIPVITYFICGFPDDTESSIINNLLYLFQHETFSGVSLFYSVPGLTYYATSIINSNLKYPRLYAGSSAFPWNNSLSTTTLITIFRLSRLLNLIKANDKTDEDQMLIKRILAEKKLFTVIKKCGITEVKNQDYHLVKLLIEKI